MEQEFYITEVKVDGSEITLIPVGRNLIKRFIETTKRVLVERQKVIIAFPDPPKVKMTLQEVCEELGKDIEIIPTIITN